MAGAENRARRVNRAKRAKSAGRAARATAAASPKRAARTPKALAREVDRLERALYRQKAVVERKRRALPPEEVPNYLFEGHDGKTLSLSDAFGTKADLIVIHNMGRHCPMCTMWADGIDGVSAHLRDRAGLLVVSNDPVRTQRALVKARGWRFPMASSMGTSFFRHMGFASKEGAPWPGVSTFHREPDGRILRIARASFGPGDDYCPTFGFLALLRDGQDGWWPRGTDLEPRDR